jgi:thermolysin
VLPLDERFVLAYYLRVRGQGTLEAVFVDAHSGEIALRYNDHRAQTATVGLGVGTWSDEKKMTAESAAGTHRAVDNIRPFGIKTYDVGFDFGAWNAYQADQDSFLATDTDNEWRDGAVVDAHIYAGYTYDYYFKRHGRKGIDDEHLAAINFVHIVRQSGKFNNAFFDPVDTSMNYGDGDGETFAFFSSGLDVVAHELTHAVTQFTSDLIYLNESGALNEAISDILAVAIEFEFEPAGRGRGRAEWDVGEDLYIDFGSRFRSFADPMSLGDPDHYSVRCDAACPEDFDNGGVHINSSIANHAFYLMVAGGTNRVSGITVDGLGMDHMGRLESIFYRAFMFYLVPSSDFSDAREATLRAARELYGGGSPEERVVGDGWDAVGVQ